MSKCIEIFQTQLTWNSVVSLENKFVGFGMFASGFVLFCIFFSFKEQYLNKHYIFLCQYQNDYFWYIHQNFLNVSVPFYAINNANNLLSREFKSILNTELTLKSKKILRTLQRMLTKKNWGTF